LWWTKRHWGRFFPSTSVSPVNHHSTNFSIIIITQGWHNRLIGGCGSQWTQLDSTPHCTNFNSLLDWLLYFSLGLTVLCGISGSHGVKYGACYRLLCLKHPLRLYHHQLKAQKITRFRFRHMMRTIFTIPKISLNAQDFSTIKLPIQRMMHPQRRFRQAIG
jgi:hypothetical protein